MLLRKKLVLVVLILTCLVAPVWGQQVATATLEGTVADPNGAAIPGAEVTVRNTQTGFTRTTTSDASGIFRLPLLPPGEYEVIARATSFSERKVTVTLTVGQKFNYDIQLSVGTSTETVNVTAEAPVVETTRQSVSSSVDAKAVSELPVNGRNFLDFVTLTPGVVRDPTRGGDLSFGGQRGTFNSVQIDGVDNNNMFFGQSLGRTGSGRAPYQFSQDAVQEFQVNTNSFSAEFGRAAGGVINVLTKSGTNEFHGTLFEFYRDRALNANSLRFVAANTTLVPNTVKPPYHFNQFGGNIGGPIKKDRAFFFFSYDGQRNTQPNIVSFGAAPPNDPASIAGFLRLAPYQASYTRGFNQDVYLGKVDIQVDAVNRLGIRYNHQGFTGTNLENGGATRAQESSGNSLVKTDTLTITLNSAFTSKFFNEFRAQVARDREPGFANSDNPEATISQGGTAVITIGRNNFSPRETTEEKYQFIDNVSYITGAHSLKGGVDVNIEKILNFFPGLFGGQYVFNSYADYNNHFTPGTAQFQRAARFTQAFAGLGTTGPTTNPNFNEFGFFLQDDWRITPNFTLNSGVRYDIQKMRSSGVTNRAPSLVAAGIDTGVINNDYNNVAPRMGFAWSPLASGRFVARGGYGLFYGRTPAIALGTAHSNNGLAVIPITINNPVLPFTYPGRFQSVEQILALGQPSAPNLFVFDKDYVQPYTQQGSLGIEFGLTNDLSISANYLYVKGTHLQRSRDINLPTPVSTPIGGGFPNFLRFPGPQGNPVRPIAGFGRITQFEATANSNYNALALTANKRMSRNFQLLASYTWSKVIDDTPDATSVVPLNAGDDSKQAQNSLFLRDDRGPGVADIRHRFVASGVWDLAYFRDINGLARVFIDGWQLSGIVQANSNAPFSGTVGAVDLNNDSNQFTDRVPGFGRNTFHFDKFVSFDFRLAKTFYFSERYRLQLIGELFNAFNRVNFSLYQNQYATVSGLGTANVSLTRRADFGLPRATFDPRIGQLAAKFLF